MADSSFGSRSSAWRARSVIGLVGLMLLGLVTACAQQSAPPLTSVHSGQNCVDDSARCIHERRLALNQLMSDPKRSWVRQPATPSSYASGVRLFAFKQHKRELRCDELSIGQREAAAAGSTLRGPAGRGLTPAQISRGAMLGEEVARDLSRESGRRCRR